MIVDLDKVRIALALASHQCDPFGSPSRHPATVIKTHEQIQEAIRELAKIKDMTELVVDHDTLL